MFCSFLWFPFSPNVCLQTLHKPWEQGGLTLPYCQKYYLAGQMMFAHRWQLGDDGDSTTVLEAATLESYESLKYAIFHGTHFTLPLAFSIKATIKAWEFTQK